MNVTDNIVDVNLICIFVRTVFLILLDRIMKKLNIDVIKVLLRFWQYLLYIFYMNWSVIHYSKYNRIEQSAIWSKQRYIAVHYREWYD